MDGEVACFVEVTQLANGEGRTRVLESSLTHLSMASFQDCYLSGFPLGLFSRPASTAFDGQVNGRAWG